MEQSGKREISITDFFKMLGLEHKEDRERFTFGASTLENDDNNLFKTIYIIKTPEGETRG